MPLTQIPNAPVILQDNVLGKLPSIWYGVSAVDADVAPWIDVAIGSEYTYVTGGTATKYYKRIQTSGTPLDADWATYGTA